MAGTRESGSGGWPDERGAGAGRAAEDEFERSLGDFDKVMEAEREAIARTGGGPAADEVFREAGRTDTGGTAGTAGRDGGGNVATSEAGGSTGASVERGQGGGPAVARTPPPEDAAPTVPGCEDTDKVARQLCEAATKEEDPFLRAALWDEYNEYKKIIARQ